VPAPGGTGPIPGAPTESPLTPPGEAPADGPAPQALPGGYQYDNGIGAAQLSPSAFSAAAAFDPSRYYLPGSSLGGPDRTDSSSNGSGGVAGSYDGASVPVFGQLGGLDGSGLDDPNAQEAASSSAGSPALPAAALAAVVALAAVTAALVRTHQASRASR
jgi:hypothetical protein